MKFKTIYRIKRSTLLTIVIIFTTSSTLFAQDKLQNQQGKLIFSIGPEYRITPIYDNFSYTKESVFTSIDSQNSGLVINVGAEFFLLNKLSIEFSNSFRYEMVVSEFSRAIDQIEVSVVDYKVLIDYQFSLNYYFKVFNKVDLFVKAGVALLNRNSEFTFKETTYDFPNSTGTTYSIRNFNFTSSKFALGYINGKNKISFGIYMSSQSPYFQENTLFTIPFISYRYNIGKL